MRDCSLTVIKSTSMAVFVLWSIKARLCKLQLQCLPNSIKWSPKWKGNKVFVTLVHFFFSHSHSFQGKLTERIGFWRLGLMSGRAEGDSSAGRHPQMSLSSAVWPFQGMFRYVFKDIIQIFLDRSRASTTSLRSLLLCLTALIRNCSYLQSEGGVTPETSVSIIPLLEYLLVVFKKNNKTWEFILLQYKS